ncbi:MAG TPA: VOC family protein [Chryseolinea sp.]|nr:VOC family protein [Chryseolinea sp.]
MKPHNVTLLPFLVVANGANAIDFYVTAFGAAVIARYDAPNGKVTSRLSIEGADFWIGDEEPEFQNLSPTTIGGTAVRMVLTTRDPDTIFEHALKAGARQICPVTVEEFWKIGKLSDPFGHIWEIGHPLSDHAENS